MLALLVPTVIVHARSPYVHNEGGMAGQALGQRVRVRVPGAPLVGAPGPGGLGHPSE